MTVIPVTQSRPYADGDIAGDPWMPVGMERHVRREALPQLREESRARAERLREEAVVRQRRAVSAYLSSNLTSQLGTPEELRLRLDSVRADLTTYQELSEQLVKVAALKNELLASLVGHKSFGKNMVIEVLSNVEMELRWNKNSKLCNLAGSLELIAPDDLSPPVEWLFPSLRERLRKSQGDEDVKSIMHDLKMDEWMRFVDRSGPSDLSARANCVLASVAMQQRVDYANVCSLEPWPSASSIPMPGRQHSEVYQDHRDSYWEDHTVEERSTDEDWEMELMHEYDDDEEEEEEEGDGEEP